MSAPIALDRIRQVSVPVRDVPRATAFYRDVLGLRHLFDAACKAFFDCGGVRLVLSVPQRAEFDHPASILYYQVGDIEAAHAALLRRGVEFVAPPHLVAPMADHELWMAFFRDGEGNTLALLCEKPLGRG